MKSPIRNLLDFTPTALLAVFTTAIFLAPYLAPTPLPVLDLTRAEWSSCFPDRDGSECEPRPARVPQDVNRHNSPGFQGRIRYSVRFPTPDACRLGSGSCSLYIAELGDSAEFRLNGEPLPSHGEFRSKAVYRKHYPVNLSLPAAALRKEGPNTLTIEVHSFKNVQAGIRGGPVGIYEQKWAFCLTRTRISQTILIPLIAAILMFVIALTVSCCMLLMRTRSGELKALLGFTVASGFFLYSFTELPREFLPVPLAGFLHFLFRILADYSFFELARITFFRNSQSLSRLRIAYWAMLLSYPVTFLLETMNQSVAIRGFDDAYLLTRLALPLLLIPHLVAFRGALLMERSRLKPVLIGIFGFSMICQINDALIFHGLRSGPYLIRVYLIPIAFGMGLWIFSRISQRMIERALHLKSDALLGSITGQVAHDIRSPLAALEMLSDHLSELPEEKRRILRNSISRIKDIANSLKNPSNTAIVRRPLGAAPAREEPVPEEPAPVALQNRAASEELLIAPVIEELITEKRLEYRHLPGIQIGFEQSRECYGLAAAIEVTAFKRVLSNLVNNSVEAIPGGTGSISILLAPGEQNTVQIKIKDDGIGIEPGILNRLGTKGATFNKAGGSGLGLAHARETLLRWNGSISIDSAPKRGTTVSLRLPKKPPPAWFVPELAFEPNSTIVVFDDDQSIHQVWRGRFLEKTGRASALRLEHFSGSRQLRDFYRNRFFDLENPLFLMDYEILGESGVNGLDLVEELGIAGSAVLVTSRYEDPSIRARCERMGLRMIPKSMSGFVPILEAQGDRSATEFK